MNIIQQCLIVFTNSYLAYYESKLLVFLSERTKNTFKDKNGILISNFKKINNNNKNTILIYSQVIDTTHIKLGCAGVTVRRL